MVVPHNRVPLRAVTLRYLMSPTYSLLPVGCWRVGDIHRQIFQAPPFGVVLPYAIILLFEGCGEVLFQEFPYTFRISRVRECVLYQLPWIDFHRDTPHFNTIRLIGVWFSALPPTIF